MSLFKKVLVAEDIDSIFLSVIKAVSDFGITQVDHVKYCDDALLKIKKSIAEKEPYDLFISDLSFEPDYREVKIKTGEEAIAQIRGLLPQLKIIVYSVEDKSFKIKSLFDNCKINAYVHKGRNSIDQLKKAISVIEENDQIYLSPNLQYIVKDKTTLEIDDYDIKIIQELSIGVTQDELEVRFKELGITPNSKSTIEKRLGKLKDHFRANNTVHLIAIAKDLGIA
ncbi:response regulator [Flavobacterium sp. N1994]|uniref:response regulator n=1 Tax=Flavobacterium sp. N1994 TaxID=2986827 RepID=UPI002221F195|nr:response regulator [Flavobacterium sp. N1994]